MRLTRVIWFVAATAVVTCLSTAVAVARPGPTGWSPTTASSGVPLPDGRYPGQPGFDSAGFYQYAPSIVQVSATQRVIYYCANTVEYDPPTHSALEATHDHALFNVGTRQPDGSYSWGPTQVALQPRLEPGDPDYHPATPSWAAYHICDPDVVKGSFVYQGQAYSWAMFFTGADNDDHGVDGRFNVVGVALATSPLGPWTIVDTPVIDITEPDYNAAGYGVGEPAAVSLDHAGHLLLFYSGLDCAALDTPDPNCNALDRGTAVRTLDLTDAEYPVLGPRSFVTTAGLTPEPFLPPDGKFLHNASWAYDPSKHCFVIARDTGDLAGNEVQEHVEVDRMPATGLGTGTWTVLGQVTEAESGFRWNSNAGMVRDPYGVLPEPAVDVYYATEPSADPPPWDGYFSYRMQHTTSPL